MSQATSRATTIRIFLIDGTPSGMRSVEKSGWDGKCLDFARADYARARLRVEVERSGVYVLIGPDEMDPEGRRQRIYVGEGDVVRTRLDQHHKLKAFWTRAYIFTGKDDSLNKAHIRYLEARLVGLARSTGLATVDNETEPPIKGLSEAERADMDAYLDESLVLLPLIGVEAFNAIVLAVPNAHEPTSRSAIDQGESWPPGEEPSPTRSSMVVAAPDAVRADAVRFFLREERKDPATVAEGRDASRGFVVLEGAVGPAVDKVMTPGYQRLRDQMRADGSLVLSGAGQLRLTRNVVFESPSAAATVLCGSNRRGPTAWKDTKGRTLAAHRDDAISGRG